MDNYPPTLVLDEDDYSKIDDCEVGETYVFEITVKMVTKSEDEDGQSRGTFKVLDVKYDDDDTDDDDPIGNMQDALDVLKKKS